MVYREIEDFKFTEDDPLQQVCTVCKSKDTSEERAVYVERKILEGLVDGVESALREVYTLIGEVLNKHLEMKGDIRIKLLDAIDKSELALRLNDSLKEMIRDKSNG
jgi:hypothetical protein